MILLSLLIVGLILIVASEMASFSVIGGFIKSKDLNEALDENIPKGTSLNGLDDSIINIGDLPFISTVPFGVLGNYYIQGVGRIWRWSKGNKRIIEIHKSLKNAIPPPPSNRDKLGLK